MKIILKSICLGLLSATLPAIAQQEVDPFSDNPETKGTIEVITLQWDVTCEVFSLPLSQAAQLKRARWDEAKSYQEVVKWVKAGRATQEEFLIVRTLNGTNASAEEITEVKFSLNLIKLPGRQKWGEGIAEAEMARFANQRIKTVLKASPGQPVLAGTISARTARNKSGSRLSPFQKPRTKHPQQNPIFSASLSGLRASAVTFPIKTSPLLPRRPENDRFATSSRSLSHPGGSQKSRRLRPQESLYGRSRFQSQPTHGRLPGGSFIACSIRFRSSRGKPAPKSPIRPTIFPLIFRTMILTFPQIETTSAPSQ